MHSRTNNRTTPGKRAAASASSDSMLDYELLTAVTGVIHQCAADVSIIVALHIQLNPISRINEIRPNLLTGIYTQEIFRVSVKAEVLLGQLLRNMRHDCEQLQMLCASTIAHVKFNRVMG